MALTNIYVQAPGELPEFLEAIQDADVPENFTLTYLKHLGFEATEQRTFIPMLKALGFLSNDGEPTARYKAFRDRGQSRRIMGAGVLEAYSDLFAIKAEPTEADRGLLERKFKGTHKCSDRLAKLMADTFFALLDQADTRPVKPPPLPSMGFGIKPEPELEELPPQSLQSVADKTPALHYNIQIHLPATKDIEVYNVIFKALKEHLID